MTASQRRESDQQARWRLASGLRLLARIAEDGRLPSWYCERAAAELGRYITLANHIEGKPADPEEARAAKLAVLAEIPPRPLLTRVEDFTPVEIPAPPSLRDRLFAWFRSITPQKMQTAASATPAAVDHQAGAFTEAES